ncbi:hypothetical protein [Methylocystis suflitae]|uniref:hypothetical protein n=1 Tax=Methylocystis suflitae TaxID=2951405 RepID=UPI002108A22E|nr:hypothetical protein [Methylocystis suflitae]MCQ4190102.1 hypothetical protein [Methylocystis suflitae]
MSEIEKAKGETIVALLRRLREAKTRGEKKTAQRVLDGIFKSLGLGSMAEAAELMAADNVFEALESLSPKPDADALIDLALAEGDFFCSLKGDPFADVKCGEGRFVTYSLASEDFRDWLICLARERFEKTPSLMAVKTAVCTLSAVARRQGERRDVCFRITKHGGKIYIDLDDGLVAEVDATGWRLINSPPVRFQRIAGMQPLPTPQSGGSIKQLRRFLNLDENSFILYVTWIIDSLRPGRRSRPILYLAGEQGAAKSTAAEFARRLIDPFVAPLRTLPTEVRDIFVDAHNSRVLAYDNVSKISPTVSDALCQIASGSGFAKRKNFTNAAQTLIEGNRPVILTGIANTITRSDLADRAVILNLSPISPEQRRSESEIWREFENELPQILGALLHCLACGLNQLPHISLGRAPRMIDFARFGVACERGFAADGDFMRAWEASAEEATEAVVEVEPVALAILAFMEGRGSWSGTAASLLTELKNSDRAEARPTRWKEFPRDCGAFGKKLRGDMATLRAKGLVVTFGKASDQKRTRTIEIAWGDARKSPSPLPDARFDGSQKKPSGNIVPLKR